MSFDKLSKKELVDVADQFGVTSTGTKNEILAELEAEGVTYDLYEVLRENAEPLVTEAPEETLPKHVVVEKSAPVASGNEVILAYRGAASQTVGDRVWSKAAPYVVVPEETAEAIIAKHGWVFEIASAKEAEAFYS